MAPFRPAILFSVKSNMLKIHGLPDGELTKYCLLSRTFSIGTIFCLLDKTRILCVGGHPPIKDVYWLSLADDNQITAAAEMVTARGWPGVILINNWVYAFGGWSHDRIRESDKYSIEGNKWQPLLPMSIPKHAFTPCCVDINIYLVEFREYQGVEKFSMVSETYTTLSVTIPTSISLSAYNVLKGREMVFLTADMQVRKWNIDTNVWLAKEFSGNLPKGLLALNCPPMCKGNKVYFVQQSTGKISTFNFTSSHLTY